MQKILDHSHARTLRGGTRDSMLAMMDELADSVDPMPMEGGESAEKALRVPDRSIDQGAFHLDETIAALGDEIGPIVSTSREQANAGQRGASLLDVLSANPSMSHITRTGYNDSHESLTGTHHEYTDILAQYTTPPNPQPSPPFYVVRSYDACFFFAR